MAVYTQLTKEQIEAFLSAYDCGALVGFEGILQGVENTNYKIETTRDRFILTVFEKRTSESDLPFFFDYMNHLHSRLVHCPLVMKRKDEKFIGRIAGKPASLISFLEGNNINAADITPQMCFEAGEFLARMHMAARDFKKNRVNSMSLSAWEKIYQKIRDANGPSELIEAELAQARVTLSLDLPKAVVHADLFPDNVFALNGRVDGAIDFYFACTDFLIYDLAITVNAWCFEAGDINKERFDRMLEGYQSLRALSADEKDAFQAMARAAALRIYMTRSHDWLFQDSDALVKPKDPQEYRNILEFHRREKII